MGLFCSSSKNEPSSLALPFTKALSPLQSRALTIFNGFSSSSLYNSAITYKIENLSELGEIAQKIRKADK